jgi:uncharacterized membrane protein YfcA
MKKLFLISIFILSVVLSNAQTWNDMIPDKSLTAKENTILLLAGFAVQTLGIGMTAGAVYLLNEDPENPFSEAAGTVGLTIAFAGSWAMVESFQNIAKARRSIHNMKKDQHQENITFRIESTEYGIGLVCRF